MKSKINLALFAAILVIFFLILKSPNTTFAQKATASDEQIPSDLSLDLNLAQQNLAPDQKQIIESQKSQAQITTSTGEQLVIKVEDIVPTEIKTQSIKDTVNPEQTSSEQVITHETLPNSSDNLQPETLNESPSIGQNFIPGTSIIEPDDNKAVSPTSFPVNNTDTPSPGPEAPQSSAPAESSSDLPPSTGDSQTAPADTPTDSTPAVQGVSTSNLPLWQKILNEVSQIFDK